MTDVLKDTNDSGDAADLRTQIDTLRDDFKGMANTIEEFGRDKLDDATFAARVRVAMAKDTVIDQAETAQLHAMEAQDQLNSFVRAQPVAAIGVAAGIGFLIGALGARR